MVCAQFASLIGDYAVIAALPFAVFTVGGSPGQVGIAFGASASVLVVFVLFCGVLGDRLSRRKLVIAADLVRFVSLGWLAVLLITGRGQFWQILVVQSIHGAGSALFLPAFTGLVPEAVRREFLQDANALRGMALSIGAIVGVAIGGMLSSLRAWAGPSPRMR